MGFRFRKSIKLGPFRLNLSKNGVGVSAGVKGARVGVGPRGVRTTLSAPGTGMSYVSEQKFSQATAVTRNKKSFSWPWFIFWIIVFFPIAIIYWFIREH
jgi:hypothetical protein